MEDEVSPTPEIHRASLDEICYQTPPRTPEELKNGMPLLENEGFLGIKVDRHAFANLLQEEGLTPQQISALEITFKPLRFSGIDYGGDLIGGLSCGNTIEIYTSVPLQPYTEQVRPALKNRFFQIIAPASADFVADTLIHEAKHYIQRCQGAVMGNSWAAKTQEEHDRLPTEIEAIQFAKSKTDRLKGKVEIQDTIGMFQTEGEFATRFSFAPEVKIDIPQGLMKPLVLAGIWDDSDASNQAWDFFDRYKTMMENFPITEKLPQETVHVMVATRVGRFLTRGKELVKRKFIATYEFNVVAANLAEKAKSLGDLFSSTIAESAIIPAAV